MTLVKVSRAGEVTLPEEIRKALAIAEGDLLEAEVVAGVLLLRPQGSLDREQAWERLMEIIERPKWQGPGPEPTEDELMDEIVEEIHAMRRENEGGSR